ncbi:MAG: hypothetical protein E6J77_19240, partial [Deltaproteobacteria bacterium]
MLVAFILLAGSGSDLARASTCDEGCVSERSVCGLAAKATYAVCRGSCGIPAADAAFRACRRECQSGYGLARVACSNERRETCLQLCDALGKRGRPCRHLCKHDPVVLACRATCLEAWVGGCRGGVQQCAADCTTTTTATTTTTTSIIDCTSNPDGGPDLLDLTDSEHGSDLDAGWTGVDHNFPLVPNATLRMCLATCGPGGTPLCDMLGLVGPGEPNGATFGAPLPLLAANVPICIVNE